MKPLVGRMAAWYQAQVGTELRKYGLRYEDLLDPSMSLVNFQVFEMPAACWLWHAPLVHKTALELISKEWTLDELCCILIVMTRQESCAC